jgi:hypothetical protein
MPPMLPACARSCHRNARTSFKRRPLTEWLMPIGIDDASTRPTTSPPLGRKVGIQPPSPGRFNLKTPSPFARGRPSANTPVASARIISALPSGRITARH